MSKPTYQVAGASRAGRSHAASQAPCQDFFGHARKAGMAAVALADGAGSKAQSQFGAETAVKASLRMLTEHFDAVYAMCAHDPAVAQQFIHDRLMRSLRRRAKRIGCELDALASTLLFAAHKGDKYLAGHIGDGVIVHVGGDGVASTLSHPENGEYSNSTYFVTDAVARSKIRLYHSVEPDAVAGFALMSDGCAESLYEKRSGSPAAAVARLLEWNRDKTRGEIASILAGNMEQVFTKKTTDDCALVLLSTPQRPQRRRE